MEKEGREYFYHTDHLGTVRFLTNSKGSRADSYDYDAFGNLLSTPQTKNTRLYTGEDRDAQTRLLYLRARYYRPDMGRFLSRDVIGPYNKNFYPYVWNNPVRFADLTGKYPQEYFIHMIYNSCYGEYYIGPWVCTDILYPILTCSRRGYMNIIHEEIKCGKVHRWVEQKECTQIGYVDVREGGMI